MRHFLDFAVATTRLAGRVHARSALRLLVAASGLKERAAARLGGAIAAAIDVATVATRTDLHRLAAALAVVEPVGRLDGLPDRFAPAAQVLDRASRSEHGFRVRRRRMSVLTATLEGPGIAVPGPSFLVRLLLGTAPPRLTPRRPARARSHSHAHGPVPAPADGFQRFQAVNKFGGQTRTSPFGRGFRAPLTAGSAQANTAESSLACAILPDFRCQVSAAHTPSTF